MRACCRRPIEGGQITSTDIENLTLTGGHLDRFKLRDSTDSVSIVPDGYSGDKGGDFTYAGGDYKLGKHTRLSYFYGELENFYRQNFAGIQHDLPLGPGVLTGDLRYFNSNDAGRAYASKIDNDMLSGQLSYAVAGHTFGGGYQNSAVTQGCHTSVVRRCTRSATSASASSSKRTRKPGCSATVTTLRRLGVPGLTFMTRYLKGNDGKSDTQHQRIRT